MDDVDVYRLSQRYRKRLRYSLLAPFLLFAFGIVVMLTESRPSLDFQGLMTYVPFAGGILFFIPAYLRYRKRIDGMLLELGPTGLRHISMQRDQSIPWEQVRFLLICKDKAGQVRGVLLRTDSGITLNLGCFEKADEIAAYATLHCKDLKQPTALERVMFAPITRWIFNGYFLVVIAFMYYVYPDEIGMEMGIVLLALVYVPYVWLFRGNLSARNTQAGFLKPVMGVFLKSLIYTAVIIVLLAIGPYFFGPGK